MAVIDSVVDGLTYIQEFFPADVYAFLGASIVVWGATLPLSARLFRRFPDAGAGLAFPLGLLLASTAYFLLRTASILEAGRGGFLIATALLALVGLWALGANPRAGRDLRRRWKPILYVLVLFSVGFLAFSFYRSHLPDIGGTEQPMDLLYLNATLTSPSYPPTDPWFAGEPASYYYLGYLQAGLLTSLAEVPPSSGYNLALAWIFGASAASIWSVTLALGRHAFGAGRGRWPLAAAGLSVVLLLGAGSLMGAFEWAAAHEQYDSGLYAKFDAESALPCAPEPAAQIERCYRGGSPRTSEWYPTEFWFWFDDTRTIPGTITEFPAFSFLLGDLHPHLMAIPLVILAIGLAFARWRSRRPLYFRELIRDPVSTVVTAAVLGGLAFQNAWDLITFTALFVVAAGASTVRERPKLSHWSEAGLLDLRTAVPAAAAAQLAGIGILVLVGLLFVLSSFLSLVSSIVIAAVVALAIVSAALIARTAAAALVHRSGIWSALLGSADTVLVVAIVGTYLLPVMALALVIYLPWALTFSSQAAGFYSYVGEGTKPTHALLQFGPVAVPALALLVWTGTRAKGIGPSVLAAALAVPGVPLLAWAIVANARGTTEAGFEARGGEAAGFLPFINVGVGWLTLGAYVLFVSLFVAYVIRAAAARRGTAPVLMLGGLGILLLLGTELFLIRDVFFGSIPRMNTVFKLSYQAWLLLAVAGGVGLAGAMRASISGSSILGPAASLLALTVLVLSLIFPLIAIPNRTDGFTGTRSIDGFDALARHDPEEYALVQWIGATVAPGDVVIEATGRTWEKTSDGVLNIVDGGGGDYSDAGRVSARTGAASPFGWYFHEVQWRGDAVRTELDRRQSLVDAVYTAPDATAALIALRELDAEYVVVGQLEKSRYPEDVLAPFETFLDLAWEDGSTRVYRLPQYEVVPTS